MEVGAHGIRTRLVNLAKHPEIRIPSSLRRKEMDLISSREAFFLSI